jgi:hypothetical protein
MAFLQKKGRMGKQDLLSLLKVSLFRKQMLKFSFEPKTERNIFVFLP